MVVSGNELIRTWTLVFTTEENYNEFLNEAASLDYNAARQTYNSNNGISEVFRRTRHLKCYLIILVSIRYLTKFNGQELLPELSLLLNEFSETDDKLIKTTKI